jgi:hypothetical protein
MNVVGSSVTATDQVGEAHSVIQLLELHIRV